MRERERGGRERIWEVGEGNGGREEEGKEGWEGKVRTEIRERERKRGDGCKANGQGNGQGE